MHQEKVLWVDITKTYNCGAEFHLSFKLSIISNVLLTKTYLEQTEIIINILLSVQIKISKV